MNTITIKDIEDLYTIKISLEGLAGRLARPILSANPEKLKALEKSCKQMESLSRKGDTEAYAKSNDEFHFHIWNSCENKWLIRILENLSLQIRRSIVRALYVPCRMEKSVREHWEIYKHLKTGNAKGVERAIGNHFKEALEDLKSEVIT